MNKIYSHPDLDEQFVSGKSPEFCSLLVKKIQDVALDSNKFEETGRFTYSTRIWSGYMHSKVLEHPLNYIVENWA